MLLVAGTLPRSVAFAPTVAVPFTIQKTFAAAAPLISRHRRDRGRARMVLHRRHYAAAGADSVLLSLARRADTGHFEVPLTPTARAAGPTLRDVRVRLSSRP